MNNICYYITDTIKNNYENISYYIKQSQQDLISYNYTDNFEIVEYICDSIHEYFYKYNYDIIIDYNKPLITFIYNNYKCDITNKIWFDDSLYWVLIITKVHHNNI